MNAFNRTALVLVCLLLMFGAATVTALAWGGPDESIDWLRDTATWLEDRNTDGTKFIITIGAVLVSMLALAVLVIEIYPRHPGQVKVKDLQAGDAILSTAAIAQRIEEAVTRVANVEDARATVRAKRKGVLVNLDLHVDPEADLVTVVDEASQAARDVLEQKVHVALLAPPRTRIHYRELRLRSRPPRRPTVDIPATSEPSNEAESEVTDEQEVAAKA